MSLDGFIAGSNDKVGPLFDWYGNGDVEVTGSDPERVFPCVRSKRRLSAQGMVEHLR
jgi:hypothetical protein